jgi:hypothetical protein
MNHAWLALLGGALQRLSDEYLEMQFAMQARKQRLELLPLHPRQTAKAGAFEAKRQRLEPSLTSPVRQSALV